MGIAGRQHNKKTSEEKAGEAGFIEECQANSKLYSNYEIAYFDLSNFYAFLGKATADRSRKNLKASLQFLANTDIDVEDKKRAFEYHKIATEIVEVNIQRGTAVKTKTGGSK